MQATIAELQTTFGMSYNDVLGLVHVLHKAGIAKRVNHRKEGPHRPVVVWEFPEQIALNMRTGVVEYEGNKE